MDDAGYMAKALLLARAAKERGEVPVGAIVVKDSDHRTRRQCPHCRETIRPRTRKSRRSARRPMRSATTAFPALAL